MVHFTQGKHASFEVRSCCVAVIFRVIAFKYSETSTKGFRPWLEFCEGSNKHFQYIHLRHAMDIRGSGHFLAFRTHS